MQNAKVLNIKKQNYIINKYFNGRRKMTFNKHKIHITELARERNIT